MMSTTTAAIIAVFIAFAITAVMGPFVIPALTRLKMSQTERTYGMESHLKKAGTPTMGGVMILCAVTVVSLIFVFRYPKIGPVLFLTLAFGLIGFFDDYLKVVKRHSDGLIAWQKLLLEFVVTAVFCIYLVLIPDISLSLRIPFAGGKMADIGFLAVPLLFFAVLGTVNAVNFTDGLDGLASSVTAVVALFFTIVSLLLEAGTAPMPAAVLGALMGFLLYNAYPAKVFMGDTGSLALGGFVVGMAYTLHMPLYILIVGIIYLCEILSVMIQVSYFKATHGKRIFKMTPIHHHFEKCNWSETRIVAVFTVITVLACLLAYLAL
ncbi:MAG: phospho-N-acetylmuramoyl-pentapeptide-transferase [Lachnospiraceae bacterium]|nr:phospho-N-acetylmuramoyl-pentapeptide-transferase [Lachnospiraceae bacterium]